MDYTNLVKKVQEKKVVFSIIADILSMTIVKSPGEMGADIAVGSA